MSTQPLATASNEVLSPASRIRRALGTTVVVSGFGYASQLLTLVALPLYLNTLGAAGYGLMVTVMALMGYLGFADAGLSWGSMILIAQANGRAARAEIASVVRHSIVLALGSGVIVLMAVAAILGSARAGWRLPMFADHPEADRLILIAGVQLMVTLQFSAFYNLFLGLQEGYWTAFYQGIGRLVGVAGGMWVAWRTHSVADVMLIQLGFTFAAGVAAIVHVWIRHPWAFAAGSFSDASQYRTQLRVGAKSFLIQIGRTLCATAPTLGISTVFGPAMVPLYTVPLTLLTSFFSPINTWNASMQSAYGEAWTSGAREWTRNAFRQSLERALVLGGAGVALFVVLGNPFIRLWTHGRLWLAPEMAASITVIVVVTALVSGSEYLLTGINRHRRAAFAQIINGIVVLAVVPPVLRWAGIGSVGFGVLAAALPTSCWVLWREIREQLGHDCFPPFSFFARIIATVVVGALAGYWAGRGGHGDVRGTVLHLISGSLLGLAAYMAVAFSLRLVVKADLAALAHRMGRRFAPAPAK